MAEAKTRPGNESVAGLIERIEDEKRRTDASALLDLMKRVTGEEPKVWAGSMIGFGQYHYKYPTGTEGDTFLAGFAPRKNEFSIYLMGSYGADAEQKRDELLARLGKHRMGKGCLYVKRLQDIDLKVLEDLTAASVSALRSQYPAG